MRGRIDFETTCADLGAAFGAPAVFVFIYPSEGGLDAGAFQPAAALGLLGHLLALHQVHAGEAAYRLLIERDGRPLIAARLVERRDLGQPSGQAASRLCDLSVQNLLPVSG